MRKARQRQQRPLHAGLADLSSFIQEKRRGVAGAALSLGLLLNFSCVSTSRDNSDVKVSSALTKADLDQIFLVTAVELGGLDSNVLANQDVVPFQLEGH